MWFRRAVTRWRVTPPRRSLTALTVATVTVFTLLQLSTVENEWSDVSLGFNRSAVHDEIERWHRQDKILPLASALTDVRWRGYPAQELYSWTEPVEAASSASDPGHMGAPAFVPDSLLKEKRRRSTQFQLNVVLSDLIPLTRSLPDYRSAQCRALRYSPLLPRAAVVIVFHNEARSTLLRTVHSVINRSPRQLIRQIILVDDDSDVPDLLSSLDEYVSSLAVPTSVVRTGARVGLIRARLRGALEASAAVDPASVLVFLDAHVEVATGWIVPLLHEISGDRSRVVQPTVDDLDLETFAYERSESDHMRGGLDWKLLHAWIPPAERLAGQTDTDAYPSPTMIGCAFAVDREYFYASGSYDELMLIWGGENVEMAVRVWRCGGSVLSVPCARVGHVYRVFSPHRPKGTEQKKVTLETATINTARFAEVWLEKYKDFFYYMTPGSRKLPLGDLSERVRLKSDLKCHDLDWFTNNVYNDSSLPLNHLYLGQIESVGAGMCLDTLGPLGPAAARTCHGLGGFQTFLYTSRREIRSGARCLEPNSTTISSDAPSVNVTFMPCNSESVQRWTLSQSSGSLRNDVLGLCLAFKSNAGGTESTKASVLRFLANVAKDMVRETETPWLEVCDSARSSQRWAMTKPANWKQQTSAENIP